MKLKALFIFMSVVFVAEIFASALFLLNQPEQKQDLVAVNDIVRSVEQNWEDLSAGMLSPSALPTELNYAVLDQSGRVLFCTKDGISLTLNDAIANRDTLLDISVNGTVLGKVFIYNEVALVKKAEQQTAMAVLIAVLFVQALLFLFYLLYLNRAVFRPFKKLQGFAVRVAGGDFDLPLQMDKHNVFGAFTESFDLMRDELKKAREAESAANRSKKELVAKLSHDIKTPVASIKAVAEVGSVRATNAQTQESFKRIEEKADQINELISNLFQATLEELQQLTVSPTDRPSEELIAMLTQADYLGRVHAAFVPPCLLYFDKLRLQQVFDNLIANSYKYANTDITVKFSQTDKTFCVRVEDYGGGVDAADLPLITEKFGRGKNAQGKAGAGLGLYLSRHLMCQMNGELTVENTLGGLAVHVYIQLSGE